jgi:hypothetical protein
MMATSILLSANATHGLIPLLAGISFTLMALLGVVLHRSWRMRRSKGLTPSRVKAPSHGPTFIWTPSSEPARKLVGHDPLGFSSDLAWLNNRDETPTSLAPQKNPSEPSEGLFTTDKFFVTNLSPAAPAEKNARRQKTGTQLPAAERLAALRNSFPAPQPRAAVSSPSGRRPRTAVLRTLDPRAAGAATDRQVAATPCATALAPPSATVAVQDAASLAGPAAAKTVSPALPQATVKSAEGAGGSVKDSVRDYTFAHFFPADEPATSASGVSRAPKVTANVVVRG